MKKLLILIIFLVFSTKALADLTGTEGLAIDLSSAGAGTDFTIAFDPTELLGSRTWGDGSTDTIVWTWNRATGTDPTITFNSGSIALPALTLTTDLAVAHGGTGASALDDGFVLLGNAAGAIQTLDVTTDGGIIIGDGTTDPVVLDVGSSAGITILGTIATGVWQGTEIADGYIPNDITIDLATLATTVTVEDETTDTTCFPAFVTAVTGSLGAKTAAVLTFNSNTGSLGATEFVGGGAGLTAIDAATGDSATDFFDAGEIADNRISDTLTSSSCTGNAATVTNATFTTALTVDTGTLTLTANAANNSVLTIGAGAVSVSGSNTGDNTVATSGDSATAFFDAGTIENARLDADLQTLATPTNWRVFYSDGSATITELALGADGTYLMSNGAAVAPTFETPGGAGDMTKAVYDSGDSGGVDKLTTVDSTYASDYVLLTGTAVGTAEPKTDGALTYDATSGTLAATEFSGGGGNLTGVDATTGDSATAFFDAGTIEHEYGGLQADVSGWTGLFGITGADTSVEVDTFDELDTAIADKALVNKADGAVWLGTHDYGGADLELPQASPAVPGVDGGIELDFTDGTVVVQHGSAHAELGSATDVVIGKLIRSFSGTIFEPDGINDVMTVKAVNSIEYPHGIVITACYLGIASNTFYTLTVQNFDDFDTINAANGTIDTVTYSADTTGEIIDTTPTYATIAAGQIIMVSIPATDVDWIHFEIYYYEPAA